MTIIYKNKCRECDKLFNESYVDDNYICHNCKFNSLIIIPNRFTYVSDNVKKSRWKFW